jgi:hypothetical protein
MEIILWGDRDPIGPTLETIGRNSGIGFSRNVGLDEIDN